MLVVSKREHQLRNWEKSYWVCECCCSVACEFAVQWLSLRATRQCACAQTCPVPFWRRSSWHDCFGPIRTSRTANLLCFYARDRSTATVHRRFGIVLLRYK